MYAALMFASAVSAATSAVALSGAPPTAAFGPHLQQPVRVRGAGGGGERVILAVVALGFALAGRRLLVALLAVRRAAAAGAALGVWLPPSSSCEFSWLSLSACASSSCSVSRRFFGLSCGSPKKERMSFSVRLAGIVKVPSVVESRPLFLERRVLKTPSYAQSRLLSLHNLPVLFALPTASAHGG